jgi:hypothetical protein
MSKKTSKNETKIDPMMQAYGQQLVKDSKRLGNLPFVPNRGITIAGFNPTQMAAFDGLGQAAAAMGMSAPPPGADMPATQIGPAGIAGYSTGPSYNQMVNASMGQKLIDRFKRN